MIRNTLGKKKIAGLPKKLEGKLDLEQMLSENKNKYLLINVLSRRARELNMGARALIRLEPPYTPLEIAIAEAKAGLLKIEEKGTKSEASSEGESGEGGDKAGEGGDKADKGGDKADKGGDKADAGGNGSSV